MKNRKQNRSWISRACSRPLAAALTFASVLLTLVVATPSAQAQTFTVLYNFQIPSLPQGELAVDSAGNVYGTTKYGGSANLGTLFEVDASGKETVLYNFTGSAGGDGLFPTGPIVRYAGNIYGTTQGGGAADCSDHGGCGTIFELSRGKETILYSFTKLEGNSPQGLVRDQSGNFYGTTNIGGLGTPSPACGKLGCGAVFKLSQGVESVLYSFGGYPDGQSPNGKLFVAASGNLYGTTQQGGAFSSGTVFELSPNSDGSWSEKVLYSFHGTRDGKKPWGGVVMDAKGNIYGNTIIGGLSTRYGGTPCSNGCGVVFKLKENADGTWTERVLYRFGGVAGDGNGPIGDLVLDREGNLYGATVGGGVNANGTVFEVDGADNEKLLRALSFSDGVGPQSGLTLDTSGNLYGTTPEGGSCAFSNGCGTVFKITP
jgi:uncharacterized repeat protein (TIGR03803 family)